MIAGRYAEQVNFRLPDGMRDAIAARAAENGRSMNSEVIKIFERALASAAATTEGSLQARTSAVALDETARQGGSINPR